MRYIATGAEQELAAPRGADALAFSADSSTFAAGGLEGFTLWRLPQEGLEGGWHTWDGGVRPALGDGVTELLFDGGGDNLLTVGRSGSVAMWDLTGHHRVDGPLLAHEGLVDADISADGLTAVTVGTTDWPLGRWRTASGRATQN